MNTLNYASSIDDINGTTSSFGIVETYLEPQLFCEENRVYALRSSTTFFQACSFVSWPLVENISVVADFTAHPLRPYWRLSSEGWATISSDDHRGVSPSSADFEILLPDSLAEEDIRKFVGRFNDSFPRSDGSGDRNSWKGQLYVPLITKQIDQEQKQIEQEDEQTSGSTELSNEGYADMDAVTVEVVDRDEAPDKDHLDPSATNSSIKVDSAPNSLEEGDGAEIRNGLASVSLEEEEDVDTLQRSKREVETEFNSTQSTVRSPSLNSNRSMEGPVSSPANVTRNPDIDERQLVSESKMLELVYDSILPPANFPSTYFTLLFHASAVFRVGDYERTVRFRLPSVRLALLARVRTVGRWHLSPVV